ncbi:hypothetical protein PVAP13_8NG068201 [Panicum virgatum]|uniref:Uncharacterized protein n=1 Tax=Panicum virgatum TaxID=38727 RepID=A0A8T0P5F0_PANVG|nr:hypothetical protein PVAP13_8NG068201 [Panicum virgatum]
MIAGQLRRPGTPLPRKASRRRRGRGAGTGCAAAAGPGEGCTRRRPVRATAARGGGLRGRGLRWPPTPDPCAVGTLPPSLPLHGGGRAPSPRAAAMGERGASSRAPARVAGGAGGRWRAGRGGVGGRRRTAAEESARQHRPRRAPHHVRIY